jgi:hypothetical protein
MTETNQQEAIRVRRRDVMAHAKKGCPSCFGRGEIQYLKPKPGVALCGCAMRRFRKAQKTVIGEKGDLFAVPPYSGLTAQTILEEESKKTHVGVVQTEPLKREAQ